MSRFAPSWASASKKPQQETNFQQKSMFGGSSNTSAPRPQPANTQSRLVANRPFPPSQPNASSPFKPAPPPASSAVGFRRSANTPIQSPCSSVHSTSPNTGSNNYSPTVRSPVADIHRFPAQNNHVQPPPPFHPNPKSTTNTGLHSGPKSPPNFNIQRSPPPPSNPKPPANSPHFVTHQAVSPNTQWAQKSGDSHLGIHSLPPRSPSPNTQRSPSQTRNSRSIPNSPGGKGYAPRPPPPPPSAAKPRNRQSTTDTISEELACSLREFNTPKMRAAIMHADELNYRDQNYEQIVALCNRTSDIDCEIMHMRQCFDRGHQMTLGRSIKNSNLETLQQFYRAETIKHIDHIFTVNIRDLDKKIDLTADMEQIQGQYPLSMLKYLRRPGNYAKRHYRNKKQLKKKMLKWQPDKIPRSLFHLSTAYCNNNQEESNSLKRCAKVIFEDIQQFMEHPTEDTALMAGTEVMKFGFHTSMLSDEIYIQLIKQTTENPSPCSCLLGWKLMFACLHCFLPSRKETKQVLLSHIAKFSCPMFSEYMPLNNVENCAANCFKQFQKGLQQPQNFIRKLDITTLSEIVQECNEYSAAFCATKDAIKQGGYAARAGNRRTPGKRKSTVFIASKDEPEPLPPQWLEGYDNSGYVYYYNKTNGNSQWDRPVSETKKARATYVRHAANGQTLVEILADAIFCRYSKQDYDEVSKHLVDK